MDRLLGKYEGYVYAIFRIVFGLLFLMHGAQKLFGWPLERTGELAGLVLAGGIIEFFGGALIMVGFLTGYAAFISSGTMAVAYFIGHFSVQAFWPFVNKGELAVVYCFAFLYMAARGSGHLSVDSLLKGSMAKTD